MRKVLSYLFFPLTIWYAVVVFMRNLLFEVGLIKQQSPAVTTIGVGNIAVGGTGKTPHVEYLLRLFSERYKTAVVSRGYKRKSVGVQIDDGSHDPNVLGDEAAMIAAKYPSVKVAVGIKRVEVINKLLEQFPDLQLVILDDSFQHRFVRVSRNILLTDYNHPFFSDQVLPFGNLRESRRGASRADTIVVTKSPSELDSIARNNYLISIKAKRYQKVYFSYIKYGKLVPLRGGKFRKTADFKHILCVTGIANPTPLLEHLRGFASVSHLSFPDHHDFSSSDMQRIVDEASRLPEGESAVITTEKDAVRLRNSAHSDALADIPIYVISMEVVFHDNIECPFDDEMRSIVEENVMYKSRLRQSKW